MVQQANRQWGKVQCNAPETACSSATQSKLSARFNHGDVIKMGSVGVGDAMGARRAAMEVEALLFAPKLGSAAA